MKFEYIVLSGLLAFSAPASAQAPKATDEHASHHAADAKSSQAFSEGEVRRIDKEAKKITLKHGPLANLDMPPMTMVFQVKDATLLDKVKAGDKVKFVAEKVGGAYLVTHLEAAK